MADPTADARHLPAAVAALCAQVGPVDARAARLSAVRHLTRARPAGALGALDMLVHQIAAIRGRPAGGPLAATASVLAADHGVAVHGTSAYRFGATGAVLRLVAAGAAPVNQLAAQVGAGVEYADFGLAQPVGDQAYSVAPGTADISRQDAMSAEQAVRAVLNGARYAGDRLATAEMLAVGEIGVGNTTATAALAARLLRRPAAETVGPGSGVPAETVALKLATVDRALARSRSAPDDPLSLLANLGGFEIAGNVGVILAAAARRQVIVLDGAITATAALLAVRLCPNAADFLVAGHESTEPVHRLLLRALHRSPLLRLDMRLGMASGATLALGLVNAALAVDLQTPPARAAGLVDVR